MTSNELVELEATTTDGTVLALVHDAQARRGELDLLRTRLDGACDALRWVEHELDRRFKQVPGEERPDTVAGMVLLRIRAALAKAEGR